MQTPDISFQDFESTSYEDAGLRQILKDEYFDSVTFPHGFNTNFNTSKEVSDLFEKQDTYLHKPIELYIKKCRNTGKLEFYDHSLYGLKLTFKILDMKKNIIQIEGQKVLNF